MVYFPMPKNNVQISRTYEILPKKEWVHLLSTHHLEVSNLIDDYLVIRSRGLKQPVMDFLFEYYSFRPSWLKKWSPGFNAALEYDTPDELPKIKALNVNDGLAYLDTSLLSKKKINSLRWILNLLKDTKDKRPSFGCFGMHEWAMVYKSKEIRHNQIPLRMASKDLEKFVESRPLVCTHFDAFRFFSSEAIPLNKNQLSRESLNKMEQPGCIHSNMDLYKWAFKGFPWISSNLLFAAFKLAYKAREIDMKASPYCLLDFGYEPIKIETEEGRIEYYEAQKSIYQKSIPIREQLINNLEKLINTL